MMLLAVLSSFLSLFLFIQPAAAQQDHYLILKRFPYMNWGMRTFTFGEPRPFQILEQSDREKRAPWDVLENTDSKRTSLKRLAILSARGFGRR